MLRRSARSGRPGQWCPPGGTLHKGESALEGAQRECLEESGLRVHAVKVLARFETATYVLCTLIDPPDALVLHAREASKARWLPPAQLLSLGTIMDLRQLVPALARAGYSVDGLPRHLQLRTPEQGF